MFSEVIKLVPSVDRSALTRMFQTLNQRFAAVARKFGDGLKNALKFGGLASIGIGLVSRLLNPLEKAEAIIDRIISKGDDAVTNAEEFQSDPGKLLRLEALAATKGLDADTLRVLLGKFQSALAKEQEELAAPGRIEQELSKETDPGQRKILEAQLGLAQSKADSGGPLREFTNETDTADAFFKFIQSIQGLEKSQQTVIQSQIFGEKIRGKASEFLNAKDFSEILAKLPSTEALRNAAVKAGKVSDENDLLRAIRTSEDFVKKSGLVDESQVRAIDQSERLKLIGEDETLKRFDALKTSSIAIQELTHKFDAFATDFLKNVAPELVKGVNAVARFAEEFLPSFNEVKKGIGEGFALLSGGFDTVIEALAEVSVALSGVWQRADELFDSAIGKIAGAVSSVESVWAEFKSSRIYRTFGGGN